MIKKGKGRITISLDENIIKNLELESIAKKSTKSDIIEEILLSLRYDIPFHYQPQTEPRA